MYQLQLGWGQSDGVCTAARSGRTVAGPETPATNERDSGRRRRGCGMQKLNGTLQTLQGPRLQSNEVTSISSSVALLYGAFR